MKSPWKFLLDLASRGRAAEQPASATAAEVAKLDEASSTPTAAPDAVPIVSPDDAAAPAVAASNLAASDRNVETSSIFEEAVGSNEPSTVSADRTPAGEREDLPENPPIKRQAPARRSSARNVAVPAGVEYGQDDADVHVPPLTFSEEVLALDEDIRQLRRQLAEKLSSQNAQLKKMLERF
ncbi:hypothetical protein [Ensifer sp. 4252]|uniref:hypothetical protein n=1 Tax=Ensifer sp. 4252 TaxID=3373915 RepID=UPI003D1AD585